MPAIGWNQSGGAAANSSDYFLPTKLAGPTNIALVLINFSSLAAYEQYREALLQDPGATTNVAAADASQVILIEDRSFLRRVPE
jgi:NIPSNAP protein